MEDIGCELDTFEQMVATMSQLFDSLGKSALRLTPHKCELRKTSINFFDNTITSEGIKPEKKIEKILNTMKLPTTVKQVKRLEGSTLFFHSFFPTSAQTLMP